MSNVNYLKGGNTELGSVYYGFKNANETSTSHQTASPNFKNNNNQIFYYPYREASHFTYKNTGLCEGGTEIKVATPDYSFLPTYSGCWGYLALPYINYGKDINNWRITWSSSISGIKVECNKVNSNLIPIINTSDTANYICYEIPNISREIIVAGTGGGGGGGFSWRNTSTLSQGRNSSGGGGAGGTFIVALNPASVTYILKVGRGGDHGYSNDEASTHGESGISTNIRTVKGLVVSANGGAGGNGSWNAGSYGKGGDGGTVEYNSSYSSSYKKIFESRGGKGGDGNSLGNDGRNGEDYGAYATLWNWFSTDKFMDSTDTWYDLKGWRTNTVVHPNGATDGGTFLANKGGYGGHTDTSSGSGGGGGGASCWGKLETAGGNWLSGGNGTDGNGARHIVWGYGAGGGGGSGMNASSQSEWGMPGAGGIGVIYYSKV